MTVQLEQIGASLDSIANSLEVFVALVKQDHDEVVAGQIARRLKGADNSQTRPGNDSFYHVSGGIKAS